MFFTKRMIRKLMLSIITIIFYINYLPALGQGKADTFSLNDLPDETIMMIGQYLSINEQIISRVLNKRATKVLNGILTGDMKTVREAYDVYHPDYSYSISVDLEKIKTREKSLKTMSDITKKHKIKDIRISGVQTANQFFHDIALSTQESSFRSFIFERVDIDEMQLITFIENTKNTLETLNKDRPILIHFSSPSIKRKSTEREFYASIDKAIADMDSGKDIAYYLVGSIFDSMEGIKSAKRWYKKSLEEDHTNSYIPIQQAMFHALLGNSKDINDAAKYVKILSDNGYPAYKKFYARLLRSPDFTVNENGQLSLAEKEKRALNLEAESEKLEVDIFTDLGRHFESGPQAIRAAIDYYTMNINDHDDADIQFKLANEISDNSNYEKEHAIALYKKSASSGCLKSQERLGDIFYKLKDYKQAAQFYRQAAQAGLPHAQERLGDIFYKLKDYKQAKHFYRQAAQAGISHAQERLGDIFYELKDYEQAAQFYHQAAQAGLPHAQERLGDIFYKLKDYKQAEHFYRQAAQAGISHAQERLGDIFYELKDYEQAKHFYRQAAQAGISHAQERLGDIFYELKDYKQAAQFYHQAAQAGLPHAQERLGDLYLFHNKELKACLPKGGFVFNALKLYTKASKNSTSALEKLQGFKEEELKIIKNKSQFTQLSEELREKIVRWGMEHLPPAQDTADQGNSCNIF